MSPRAIRVITWVVALVIGLAVLILAAIGVTAATLPDCARCHMKDPFKSATLASSHGSVACGSCHGGASVDARLRFGSAQVLGMYLGVTKVDPTVATVASAKCRACHSTDIKGTTKSSGLRIRHADCAKGRECTECHSTVAHGSQVAWPRTPGMELCFECHKTGGPTTKCDACHAGKLPSERIKSGTWAALHGDKWLQTHGMGDMNTCGPCHAPRDCAKCHGKGVPHSATFMVEHPSAARSPQAKCTMCHKGSFCMDCHGYVMPHPRTFVVGHAKIVKRDGQAACEKCHDKTDCQGCHINHVHPTTLEELDTLGVITLPATRTPGGSR